MKKIITLLVSVTMVASAFAQFGSKDQRDNGYGNGSYGSYGQAKVVGYSDGKFNDSYAFSPKERDMQIAQINFNIDRKIMVVKSKFFMSRSKKEQVICQLEDQRKDEIKMVMIKFNTSKNHFDKYDRDHDQKRNW